MPPTHELHGRLAQLIGPRNVIVDAAEKVAHERDWTGRYRGHAQVVVKPADARQVSAVLELCRRCGTAVVPQGGNTGLVGGGCRRTTSYVGRGTA